MDLHNSDRLSKLAAQLAPYYDIEELLEEHKIVCLCQCMTEFYDGDDYKMFQFGHKYWENYVVTFNDYDFMYYAVVQDAVEIEKIFKTEIKNMTAEEKEENP